MYHPNESKKEPADNHPLSYNVGESCYSKMKIQPVQYSEANGLSFLEGDVVKRLTRWRRPGGKGKEDLLKCRHEIDQLIYFEENGYE
jgi:hypothetical protein